jgi:hypothetical protein
MRERVWPSPGGPGAPAGVRQLTRALILLLAGTGTLATACGGEEAGPRTAAAASPAATAAGRQADPLDRGVVALVGDHRFESPAAVACAAQAGPTAPGPADLTIELKPDEPDRPVVVLHVPAFAAAGAYPASFSLRLTTADGTFTESVGEAQVSVERRSDGPGTRLSGAFAASFAGAAGEGEATGSFSGCTLR